MLLNITTFEMLLRKRGLTQAALAQRARLGTKTIGRIRRGEELRSSNAEKIATALGVSLEELQQPPSDKLQEDGRKTSGLSRLVADLSGQARNALTLASLRYKIPETTILEAGPYMFALLAELSLKRRRDKLEAWKDAALAALEPGPRGGLHDVDFICNEVWCLYEEELESIEKRDLSGGFSDRHPAKRTKENPGHLFLGMLQDLAAECGHDLDYVDSVPDDFTPFSYDVISYAVDEFFDPENEYDHYRPDEDACFLVGEGQIVLRDMPRDLLESGSGPARRAWVSKHPDYRPYGTFNDEADAAFSSDAENIEPDDENGGPDA